MEVMQFGKFRGMMICDIPTDYLQWGANPVVEPLVSLAVIQVDSRALEDGMSNNTKWLYDVLRYLGLARRRIIEKTLNDIERDEAAARQRVLDAAARLIEKREEN